MIQSQRTCDHAIQPPELVRRPWNRPWPPPPVPATAPQRSEVAGSGATTRGWRVDVSEAALQCCFEPRDNGVCWEGFLAFGYPMLF
jgi:hypothetical protein